MELRYLRYFVAVADALSFTKAAEHLHLAQPSLTRQIKDLEAEIGVQLFNADREPAVISFVAAGLGVAVLPEQIKRLSHQGVTFQRLRQRLTAESWAVWKVNNSSDCLKQYIRIVKELS
jgi:DNA-binding transcriptional LysR family regulator